MENGKFSTGSYLIFYLRMLSSYFGKSPPRDAVSASTVRKIPTTLLFVRGTTKVICTIGVWDVSEHRQKFFTNLSCIKENESTISESKQ